MDQHQNNPLFQLNLDAQNSFTLRSAASWAKVLGIVGLAIGGLCILLGILVQQAFSSGNISYGYSFRASTLGNGGLVVYVLMGIVFIVSSIFALNAGNKISLGLRTNDQYSLNSGFAGIRNYFAFWAILLIIFLILLLFSLLGMAGAM